MSEKEKQTTESMANALKDMDEQQVAVAIAYVEGMRAQKQMQEGNAGCRN